MALSVLRQVVGLLRRSSAVDQLLVVSPHRITDFMSHQSNRFLITAALVVASASFARADLVMHELGGTAANTLNTLGTDFVVGCSIVAAAIVAAVFISKKK